MVFAVEIESGEGDHVSGHQLVPGERNVLMEVAPAGSRASLERLHQTDLLHPQMHTPTLPKTYCAAKGARCKPPPPLLIPVLVSVP